jgi:hypothetical protein
MEWISLNFLGYGSTDNKDVIIISSIFEHQSNWFHAPMAYKRKKIQFKGNKEKS